MRKWIPVALIVLAILWFVLTNLGSTLALADFSARPLLALSRADTTVAIEQPGDPNDGAKARFLQAEGVMFGHRFTFALPDGATVACTHRFRSLTCADGWQPVRAP